WLPGRGDALVFDPGLQPDLVLDVLREHGLEVAAIVNTHGHADHIAGNAALKEAFPRAPIVIGVNDAVMLSDAEANLSAPFCCAAFARNCLCCRTTPSSTRGTGRSRKWGMRRGRIRS